ncbi:MAG: hypothetical protein ACK4WH_07570 [Phycisphaerales bacterium]
MFWIQRVFVFAAAAAGLAGSESYSQIVPPAGRPEPSVMLSDGPVVPRVCVSSMRIQTGGWRVKPIYEIDPNGVRVLGLLVTAAPDALIGSNLSAVYYARPVEDCGEWTATAWAAAKPWAAVEALKAEHGIPDVQDPLWEVERGDAGAQKARKFSRGFMSDDPMGPRINAMPDPAARAAVVGMLKLAGYPVADIPFEGGDPAFAKAWLISAARFFDKAIGREGALQALDGLGDGFGALRAEAAMGASGDLVRLCSDAFFAATTPRCAPTRIEGEWRPYGEECECRTIGPWAAACGRFRANINGKIEVQIPFPPPRGQVLTYETGIGGELDLCVCVWQRSCKAESRREVEEISEDCLRRSFTEFGPRMTFTEYGYMWATSSSECQRAAFPIEMIQPDEEPCGLRPPGR